MKPIVAFPTQYDSITPVISILRKFIPTLYVMGDQDLMFLEPVKKIVRQHKNSILETLKECGHVVNVERPDEFNRLSLEFIKNKS